MFRKLSCLSLTLVLCALAVACKRDADVGAVVDELNSFTQELVKRVESNPNPSAGVDDAQKYFDSRKDEIKGKLDSIKNVREAQVSEETKKKMLESFTNNVMSVSKLQIKYMSQSMRDPALRGKIDKLTKDYTALLQSIGN
jgi:Tfp pilus assembly protein PilP